MKFFTRIYKYKFDFKDWTQILHSLARVINYKYKYIYV
jgi:hypothetical protein